MVDRIAGRAVDRQPTVGRFTLERSDAGTNNLVGRFRRSSIPGPLIRQAVGQSSKSRLLKGIGSTAGRPNWVSESRWTSPRRTACFR